MMKRYAVPARPVLLPLALTAGICVAAQDESEDHQEEQLSDSEDEKKASQVEWPSDDKAARLTQTWRAKKAKYQKYASKGKVEKLERALARQQAKLQQAMSTAAAATAARVTRSHTAMWRCDCAENCGRKKSVIRLSTKSLAIVRKAKAGPSSACCAANQRHASAFKRRESESEKVALARDAALRRELYCM